MTKQEVLAGMLADTTPRANADPGSARHMRLCWSPDVMPLTSRVAHKLRGQTVWALAGQGWWNNMHRPADSRVEDLKRLQIVGPGSFDDTFVVA